jgi:hypothetical protein
MNTAGQHWASPHDWPCHQWKRTNGNTTVGFMRSVAAVRFLDKGKQMNLPMASDYELPKVYKSSFGIMRSTTRKYMKPGEQEVLLALIDSVSPSTMVEIGVCEGLTALAVLRHVKSIYHYIGVDVDATYKFEIRAQRIERPRLPGVLVQDDPRFELRLRGSEMPTSTDVVFIDGDHGRKAVMRDSMWAAEVVTPGGLIIWHDYGNETVEVTGVLNGLHRAGRDIQHVAETWLAFEQR